jgi:hypothetical protein
MALPDSIQKQLDEAEALEALMAADPDTPESQEPEQPEAAPVEPAAEPEKPVTPPRDGDWEHKYKSLEGKFNSQASKFQQEISTSQAQIQELTDELAKLKQKPVEQSKSREAEEDEELVGADIVKAAERAAERKIARVEAKLNSLETENNDLKQRLRQVSESQSSLSETDFYGRLTGAVSDWRSLESSELGQAFLLSRIPGTGQTWNEALISAASNFNVAEAAEIYSEIARRHPELRAEKPKPVKSELEKQIAPNKNKSTVPVETKKIWTQKEANDSWESINKRLVKGKEAEELEAELEAAMLEGRIR